MKTLKSAQAYLAGEEVVTDQGLDLPEKLTSVARKKKAGSFTNSMKRQVEDLLYDVDTCLNDPKFQNITTTKTKKDIIDAIRKIYAPMM